MINHEYARRLFNGPDSAGDCTSLFKYFQRVRQPMDLMTVRANLLKGSYSSPEAMASDVNLIWRNVRYFNKSESYIFRSSRMLSDLFDRLYRRIPQMFAAPRTADAACSCRVDPKQFKVRFQTRLNQGQTNP